MRVEPATETAETRADEAAKPYSLPSAVADSLTRALDREDKAQVHKLLAAIHGADIAEYLQQVPQEKRERLLPMIPTEMHPEMLLHLEHDLRDAIIALLGTPVSAQAIEKLESDDAVQVMEDLGESDQQDILEAMEDPGQRRLVEESLACPEETAGRLMNPKYVAIPRDWNVGDTIDFLRDNPELPDDFYNIFIVDQADKPVGYVLVSRVLRSQREVKISDIMEQDLRTVATDTDQEDVAFLFRKYGLTSAAVTNDAGQMAGVVAVDDIVDVVDEEAEEDIMRMAGVKATDMHASFVETAWHRFPWLFVNLLTAIAASVVIAFFDGAIERLVALAVLMPIVASMAGNAGMQTLTVAVRALATRELTFGNAVRVVRKELFASCVNGVLFGVMVWLLAWLIYQDGWLAIIFGVSVALSLAIAALAGIMIPLLLVRKEVDPAVASSVFLTTVTDISAFFLFLGLATLAL